MATNTRLRVNKNIEPRSFDIQYQISILKNYGYDLGSISKQAQTQNSGQGENILNLNSQILGFGPKKYI